jgi:hypothetical protein
MGGSQSCPSGQHWDSNAGTTISGGQGSGTGPSGACVDNPPPPAEVANTQSVSSVQAGTVFDSTAQNAQRPAWNQLSPLHL